MKKKIFYKPFLLLVLVALMTCSITTNAKETTDVKVSEESYQAKIRAVKGFLYNEKPLDAKVGTEMYLTYTVAEEVSVKAHQQGLLGTAEPLINYPYQNGGLLGGTMTLYKGNFFNATTISVGASVSDSRTMYGSEDFAMLYSGVANKTGYNFEFKEGKCILQPSLLLGYTFVNAFDYTNAAGVRIDNDSLHAVQVAPGVKFIGNTKAGWQPYLSVSMVWNVMGRTDVVADGVRLPSMSIKPYVQYGVGVQKRVKDNFMAYGQAMLYNGGRNGVSLTAGFRWALGYGNSQYKEVQKDCKNLKTVKILKQMSPYQKTAFIKSK
jgi:hypothetical protein